MITQGEAINDLFEHISKQELKLLSKEWKKLLKKYLASFPTDDKVWATWTQIRIMAA